MHLIYSIVSWLVFGLIVGAIARLLVPGRQTMSWLTTIAMGVIGSFVGGSISWLIFGTANNQINPAGWIMSIVGGVIVVLLYIRLTSK